MKKLLKSFVALSALSALAMPEPASAQSEPHETKARAIYAHIIGLRTAAGHSQTAAMARYLASVLMEGGVADTDVATLEAGGETAMLVRIPGSDASARPILFSAHMDIVDARPEDWTRDPFTLVEENGTFYGRGTSDNKAGVTALVSTVLRFESERLVPSRTLVFAFVGDEETNMDTTRAIAAHDWVKGAELAINSDAGGGLLDDESGKPLIYLVQGAEKTYATFEITATNAGGHSSRPRADNAIYDLARAVSKIEAYRFPVMSNELTLAYLGAVGEVQPGGTGAALRAFAKDPTDAAAADALAKSPEFVGATRTTCVATMLDAGHAENALPQKATATINCRIFPGVEVDAVRDALVAAVGNPALKFETLGTPAASPVSEMRPDVTAAIEKAVHAKYPGVPIVPYLESGGTDGKIYRVAGIPTYASSGLFSKPSEMFAHGLNERLPVNAFYEGLDHIYRLAVELGGAAPAQ
ncbi:MAG TPA: M20/M25/M40 family metallo-hydrolase [Candidatus Saccharimonadia bacterium]|nr:M20/M25/M40 family metallo-hydrolase [Candidatus Saccharimonadia bacterium]